MNNHVAFLLHYLSLLVNKPLNDMNKRMFIWDYNLCEKHMRNNLLYTLFGSDNTTEQSPNQTYFYMFAFLSHRSLINLKGKAV
ncbi:hypothetical protein ACJX0J_035369, partial [Zea mays]